MPQELSTQGLGRAACCRVSRNCILASNDYTALDMFLKTRQYNLSAESSSYQTKLLRLIKIHTSQHTIKNWSGGWRSAVSCISLMHGRVVENITFRTFDSSFFSKVPECASLNIKAYRIARQIIAGVTWTQWCWCNLTQTLCLIKFLNFSALSLYCRLSIASM